MAEDDTHSVAYPKFDETQLASLGRCPLTKLKRFCDGEKLFEAAERDFNFYVINSGKVEIVDEASEPPKTIVVHTAGEFTGDVAQLTGSPSLVSAIARGDCEAYEVTPEALRQILNHHPALGDVILQAFLARRQLLRKSGTFAGLRVIGSRYSQDTFRVRDFLAKNLLPFAWLDLETDPRVNQLLKQFGVTEAETPVVAWRHKLLLRNPSNRQLAEVLGLRRPLEHAVYDLVIVGAGPAGLAAAVYGASEGLSTVVLERTAPGGQAGRSMRIENYLGFPIGITGSELAERAVVQANKFGARLDVAVQVASLSFDQSYSVLQLEDGETVVSKLLLIATGAEYRRLNAEGCGRFEGCGVYYAATPNEAQLCKGADAVIVGGGNSAGQAAVFLAEHAQKVFILIRDGNLGKSMSSYLYRRIEDTPNIEVLRNTTIQRMCGDGHLSKVEVLNEKTGETRTLETPALFSFIGAVPRTDWLPKEIETDSWGFILTGPALAHSQRWKGQREPYLLETSRPGVFAAGDVRSGSIKRVASAVGEGSMAVQFAHACLKEM
jgi:thioredoxin reductase (NADPH)